MKYGKAVVYEYDDGSLPVRGAWIEMARYWVQLPEIPVAPRAGSVD